MALMARVRQATRTIPALERAGMMEEMEMVTEGMMVERIMVKMVMVERTMVEMVKMVMVERTMVEMDHGGNGENGDGGKDHGGNGDGGWGEGGNGDGGWGEGGRGEGGRGEGGKGEGGKGEGGKGEGGKGEGGRGEGGRGEGGRGEGGRGEGGKGEGGWGEGGKDGKHGLEEFDEDTDMIDLFDGYDFGNDHWSWKFGNKDICIAYPKDKKHGFKSAIVHPGFKCDFFIDESCNKAHGLGHKDKYSKFDVGIGSCKCAPVVKY
ncbi:hypothetical protein AJ80_06076 [Polytolypa hystricis UAMH7299]|uniref:Uncharacterized protein n=1 Tax=Polytolypa hystricis (strain UAMH7299) TaxID=1447883 RepID=A0A2B7XZM1_POLH7|nr:hypothetical protein AJ80_06076 [Polytolypa hystricis UAMH7299]